MRLENWSIGIDSKSLYDAPECCHQYLQGEVFGHPRFKEGKRVITSNIKKIDGSQVTTESGSVYVLGQPHKEYVEWCHEQGCHIPTPEEPIKRP